jgi:hypothetical protein
LAVGLEFTRSFSHLSVIAKLGGCFDDAFAALPAI